MRVFMLMVLFSVATFAKSVYLVDTPKCKVYFDESNRSRIFVKDFCELEEPMHVIDNIKYTYESKKVSNVSGLILSSKPTTIKYRGQNLLAFKLGDRIAVKKLLTTPLYKRLKINDEHYNYMGYISRYKTDEYGVESKHDLLVLKKYEKALLERQRKVINSIPREIEVEEISTPVSFANEVENLLKAETKLRYEVQTFEEVVKQYKDANLTDYSNLLIDLINNRRFLKKYTFEQKLEMLKSMHKHVNKKYWSHTFTLYGVLSNEHRFKDETKNIEAQIEALKYLIDHYETYRALVVYNEDDEVPHVQPDAYGEIMISNFKKEVKDNALILEYQKLMRIFYLKARKDVTYYSMQSILMVLSNDKSSFVHDYFQKVFEKRLAENKEEHYFLGIDNYMVTTYVGIGVKCKSAAIKKILNALQNEPALRKINSEFSTTLKKEMSRDEIIAKLLKLYGLSKDEVKIFKTAITVEGKKYN